MFLAGQKLRAADLNKGIGTIGIVEPQVVVNNSTTLVSIADLSFPVEAGEAYVLEGCVFYTSATNSDIKFGLSLPSSTGGRWGVCGLHTSGTTSAGDLDIAAGALANTHSRAGIGAEIMAWIEAYIAPTADGSAILQFAQATAQASNTTIHVGSHMSMRRVS